MSLRASSPPQGSGFADLDELCRVVVQEPAVTRLRVQPGRSVSLNDQHGSFSVVVDGALAVKSLQPGGRSVPLEILGAGACIPPGEATSGPAASLTLQAMLTSVIARVPSASFQRTIQRYPHLAALVGAKMAAQHRALLERLAMLAVPMPRPRVAGAVLYLAQTMGARCALAEGRRVTVSQTTVAEVADVSRQTANRFLREFQAQGLVRIERSMLCIRDSAGLANLAAGKLLISRWKPCGPCAMINAGEPLTCFPLVRQKARKPRRK